MGDSLLDMRTSSTTQLYLDPAPPHLLDHSHHTQHISAPPSLIPNSCHDPYDTHLCQYGNGAALGKLVAAATAQELDHVGWQALVLNWRGPSHLASDLKTLPHKACRLLHHLQARSAAVTVRTSRWTGDQYNSRCTWPPPICQ